MENYYRSKHAPREGMTVLQLIQALNELINSGKIRHETIVVTAGCDCDGNVAAVIANHDGDLCFLERV